MRVVCTSALCIGCVSVGLRDDGCMRSNIVALWELTFFWPENRQVLNVGHGQLWEVCESRFCTVRLSEEVIRSPNPLL